MKKIIVISNQDAELSAALGTVENAEMRFSANERLLPDTACALISQRFAGKKTEEMAASLQRQNIPFAVVTFDKSEENEELLLDLGVTNIIALPMPAKLVHKRIEAICRTSGNNDSEAGFALFSQIAASDDRQGAYVVQEADFTNIYRYVRRLQERMDKEAQLVRFSFHDRFGDVPEPGTLEEAFPIVQRCLRRGDIVSICGNAVLAILIGANQEGGRIAAERILNTYHAHCVYSGYEMRYEMQRIQ